MKIKKVHSYMVEIPYKSVYETSHGTTPSGRHVVIKIETESGIIGWGESGIISRTYPFYGDTPETIYTILNSYLAPTIIGMDAMSINSIIDKLEDTIKGNYFAKCAVDHAIYDICGKALNISVAEYIGGSLNTKFSVSRSLPLGAPATVINRARQLSEQGYRRFTLKAGKDYRNDIDCFKAMRKEFGGLLELEIDANGGYDKATAIKVILALEPYDLDAIEQPIPPQDILGLVEVKAKVNVPIIADESVFIMRDLTEVIRNNAADIVCLKPFKSGGIYFSKKMQSTLEAFNIPISIGSMHPFGIGTAALHQFTSTIKSVTAVGYGEPLERFVDDIVKESCFVFKDGEVTVYRKPGLGIEVNLEKLEHYTTKYRLTE